MDHFGIIKILGSGSYGWVAKSCFNISRDYHVAIKFEPFSMWRFHKFATALERSTTCVHDGIGRIVSYFPIEILKIDEEVCVLMGLVQELGDATLFDRIDMLHTELHQTRTRVESGDVAPEHFCGLAEDCLVEMLFVFDHLLDAVIALDENSITHRDLKPINIVRVNGIWKIVDFGEARLLPQTVTNLSLAGTQVYWPPVNNGRSLNHDTYSLACIL